MDRLEVDDYGTGEGVALVGSLTAAPPAFEGTRSKRPGDVLHLELHPTSDPRWIRVARLEDDDFHVVRDELSDRVLMHLTMRRLDDPAAPVRLHSAAVADRRGHVALLIGASGAGKSTLTAHLVAGGLDLVSDEQVGVHDDHRRVTGFTRPVAIKPDGVGFLPDGCLLDRSVGTAPRLLAAGAMRGRHRVAGVPVLVAFLDRCGVERPSWSLLDPAEALVALAANNLDMVRRPERAMRALAWLASTVPVVSLKYAESRDAVGVVRSLIAAPPEVRPAEWRVARHESIPRDSPGANPSDAVQPTTGLVTVMVGDEVVLLSSDGRHLLRIEGARARAWLSLPRVVGVTDPDRPFVDELRFHRFVE